MANTPNVRFKGFSGSGKSGGYQNTLQYRPKRIRKTYLIKRMCCLFQVIMEL